MFSRRDKTHSTDRMRNKFMHFLTTEKIHVRQNILRRPTWQTKPVKVSYTFLEWLSEAQQMIKNRNRKLLPEVTEW